MKPIEAQTCVKAWSAAVEHLLRQNDWRDYNLILEIAEPMCLPKEDKSVHNLVDNFLAEKADKRLSTVINTIFPATLYARYGRDGVFDRFPKIWPTLEKHPDIIWGTYLRRMTHRERPGKGEMNPLEILIDKIKKQMATGRPMHATYEMGMCDVAEETEWDIPIYDPTVDARSPRGRPCLSHLSLKLKHGKALMLTALYRSHHYIDRALGNLLGLAWLQHFIAAEAGIPTAELVCISTMGILDTEGWGKGDVTKLLDHCRRVMHSCQPTEQDELPAVA